jgi:histidine ammonia-lyase
MERWLKHSDIVAAMSIEALLGNLKPYNRTLHELRGFGGAVISARNIMKVLEGSDLTTGKMKAKVQDAYSMRSTPQVVGAARDAIAYADIVLSSCGKMRFAKAFWKLGWSA